MKLHHQNKGIPTAERNFARVSAHHMCLDEQLHIRRETTTEEKPTEEKKAFCYQRSAVSPNHKENP